MHPVDDERTIFQAFRLTYAYLRRSCAVVVLVVAANSPGETLDWLYDVEFNVTSQAASERAVALREGLEVVLLRVTGLGELPASPELTEAFARVNAYQLQFRYEERDAPESKWLIVNYDANAIHELIRNARLPVWSAQRPHVLFLVSVVEEERRKLLSDSVTDGFQTTLRATAARRGIAYSQPILDFTDKLLLREGAVAFDFLETTDPLRLRLQADVVVMARVDPRAFQRQRIWLLILDEDDETSFLFDAPDMDHAIAEIVNRAADHLAARYAIMPGDAASIRLVVTGISTVVEYKGVLDYLEQWEFIDRVLVSSVAGDRFEFELRTASTWEQFAVYLAQGEALIPNAGATIMPDRTREYRWLGAN